MAVVPYRSLDDIADEVRWHQERGRTGLEAVLDAYLGIGRCLEEARDRLPDNAAFGAWCREQQFGFKQKWAWTLRQAASHEVEVRKEFSSQLLNGRVPNFEKVVVAVRNQSLGSSDLHTVADPLDPYAEHAEFPTIVIDPPWRYENTSTRNAAEKQYPTMSYDELADLELPAADNAHLYLWVTNPFIREGLGLCEAWGFTYKTLLTWVKPQIGMGNYFRSASEHVIFGIRGQQPTLRNNVPTWFQSDRLPHSQKPEVFYDLVESCSPGPYFEMFARRRRLGPWTVWGNEA